MHSRTDNSSSKGKSESGGNEQDSCESIRDVLGSVRSSSTPASGSYPFDAASAVLLRSIHLTLLTRPVTETPLDTPHKQSVIPSHP